MATPQKYPSDVSNEEWAFSERWIPVIIPSTVHEEPVHGALDGKCEKQQTVPLESQAARDDHFRRIPETKILFW